EALALVAEATGARRGYLELHARDGSPDDRYAMARGCTSEEVEAIRFVISRGIVAEAIATGRTVATTSAAVDPRFRERDSVRAAARVPSGGRPRTRRSGSASRATWRRSRAACSPRARAATPPTPPASCAGACASTA